MAASLFSPKIYFHYSSIIVNFRPCIATTRNYCELPNYQKFFNLINMVYFNFRPTNFIAIIDWDNYLRNFSFLL